MSPINRKAGISDALPSEEVLRSLNINVLHQSLSQFGIIEVSPEVRGAWNLSLKNVYSDIGNSPPGGVEMKAVYCVLFVNKNLPKGQNSLIFILNMLVP